jgi:pimeloyl-ACP methyl ester carboxylesterase
MLTTTSADGTSVRAYDEGHGPAIVLLGPGLDDGTRDKRLANILAKDFRVVRLHRRQFRLDLKADPKLGGAPSTVVGEVEDVLAVVRAVGEPVVLYGHSDGAVVALEALAASPSSFADAVIYEPAAVIGPPLAGEGGVVLAQARAVLAEGRPGKAITIFSRDAVQLPPWQAWLASLFTTLIPRYRRLVPAQPSSPSSRWPTVPRPSCAPATPVSATPNQPDGIGPAGRSQLGDMAALPSITVAAGLVAVGHAAPRLPPP